MSASLSPAPASAAAAPATEALAGLVERVTYHNAENGFCVLRLKARGQRDLVTLVGHTATIATGEWVQASGAWVNDRTHGLQFRAQFLRSAAPTTVGGRSGESAAGVDRRAALKVAGFCRSLRPLGNGNLSQRPGGGSARAGSRPRLSPR